MSSSFTPRLEILPPRQRAIWPLLGEVPHWFTLYGRTAIALHLGHRESIDFDFFADRAIDPAALLRDLDLLREARPVQLEPNTLSCLVGEADDPVRLSFFGLPRLGRVAPPLVAPGNELRVASLLDLAGSTVAVVQRRAEPKDYVDLDALIRAGIGLDQALAAGAVLYGAQFNPQITLKALSYFGEPALAALPDALKARLRRAVRAVGRS